MPAGNRHITINGERTVEICRPGPRCSHRWLPTRYSCPRLAGREAATVCAVAGSCREEGRYCLPRPDFYPQATADITGWLSGKGENDLQIQSATRRRYSVSRRWSARSFPTAMLPSFIKEFVVRVPEGEVRFPARQLCGRSMSPLRHQVYRYGVDDKFRDEWDKYKMWD